MTSHSLNKANKFTLVLGGTGKTGRRICARLESHGCTGPRGFHDRRYPRSIGTTQPVGTLVWRPSRRSTSAIHRIWQFLVQPMQFRNWSIEQKHRTWNGWFLLSGRGEAEAQACERIVQASGLDWTIVRASWFNQNFSEGAFVEMVKGGANHTTGGRCSGTLCRCRRYRRCGRRSINGAGSYRGNLRSDGTSLNDLQAGCRGKSPKPPGVTLPHIPIPHEAFVDAVKESGAPKEVAWMLDYLFCHSPRRP